MNGRNLADRIGNIDDRLIWQAEGLRNFQARRRNRMIMRLAAGAAVAVLMLGSFAAGASVFAREAAEPEMVLLDEIGLTLILPDDWKGNYEVEMNEMEGGYLYTFYDSRIHGQGGEWADGGALFYIGAYGDRPMTQEEMEAANVLDGAVPYQYLCSTRNTNYIMVDVTDMQYDPGDAEMAKGYGELIGGIEDIRFVLEDVWD